MHSHEYSMNKALTMAYKAMQNGEVPVGAVIVHNNRVIATGFNRREEKHDAVAHAEILAIQKANKLFMDWRLPECDMYVTLEPCPMCLGAALNSRLRHIYFGAYDPNSGACGGKIDVSNMNMCNHNIGITGGLMQKECSELLKAYFASRRTPQEEVFE